MNNKGTLIAVIVAFVILAVGFAAMNGAFKSKSSPNGTGSGKTQENVMLSDSEKADADKKAQAVVVNPLLDEGSGAAVAEKSATCERYSDLQAKNDCYEAEERDAMYSFASIKECSTLKYAKVDCEDYFYLKSAENEKNPRYCAMIKEEKVSESCADKVGYLAAIANSDAKYCEPIKSVSLKNQCIAAVQSTSAENAKIVAEESAFQKASTQGDTAACATLSDPLKVASCIEPAVTRNLDISLCSKVLTKKEDVEICYKKLAYDYDRMVIRRAYQEKSATVCDKAYDPTIRAQCKQMKFQ